MAKFEVLRDFTVMNGNVPTVLTAGKSYDSKEFGITDKSLQAMTKGKSPFVHIDKIDRPPVQVQETKKEGK